MNLCKLNGKTNYLDIDAVNIITAINTTDVNIRSSINRFVKRIKTFNGVGYWSKIKAIYPFFSNSVIYQKLNWKNPFDTNVAFRLNFVSDNESYHLTDGWRPASNSYANTYLNPFSILSTNSLHFIGLIKDVSNSVKGMLGGVTKAGGANIYLNVNDIYTGKVLTNYATLQVLSETNSNFRGLIGINRNSSTILNLYKDNDIIGFTNTSNTTTNPNENFYIGAWNNGGAAAYYLTNSTIQFISIGDGLTDLEYADYVNAIWKLNTDLGRLQDGIFFGDSMTAGVGASPSSNRWTTLISSNKNIIEVNKGLSGGSLEHRTPLNPAGQVNFVDQSSIIVPIYSNKYKYLFIFYGANDIGFNFDEYSITNFKTDYRTCLNTIIDKGWPKSTIILLTPSYFNQTGRNVYTTYGVITPADINRHLAFVQAVLDIGIEYEIKTLDIYHNALMTDSDLYDNLHPGNSGYSKIANYVESQTN